MSTLQKVIHENLLRAGVYGREGTSRPPTLTPAQAKPRESQAKPKRFSDILRQTVPVPKECARLCYPIRKTLT